MSREAGDRGDEGRQRTAGAWKTRGQTGKGESAKPGVGKGESVELGVGKRESVEPGVGKGESAKPEEFAGESGAAGPIMTKVGSQEPGGRKWWTGSI